MMPADPWDVVLSSEQTIVLWFPNGPHECIGIRAVFSTVQVLKVTIALNCKWPKCRGKTGLNKQGPCACEHIGIKPFDYCIVLMNAGLRSFPCNTKGKIFPF
jgi:hypothetical protein